MGDTVVVTGASGGVGAAVVRAFAGQGDTVVAAGYDRDAVESVAADAGAVAVRTDVRDEYDVERLMEQASRAGEASGVDVVVPCAAVDHSGGSGPPLGEESYSGFDDTIRTNVRGVFAAVREALPHMPADGRVVIPTERVARDPEPGRGSFAVSKAAVEGVMGQFSVDCEQAVGCVDPGEVNTGIHGGGGRKPADVAGLFTWAASVPGALDGRVLDADDWEDAAE
ncbi:SDR family oxidoreductase [Halobacterium zhouii]|uniref:SDR family oxidoreductase n=1 Tax=Halobacterium zhouii TaxID=2902624 RepID=UPI001E5D9C4C|nr:SDR family oxidoreductase [Halobacterium zhouii]